MGMVRLMVVRVGSRARVMGATARTRSGDMGVDAGERTFSPNIQATGGRCGSGAEESRPPPSICSRKLLDPDIYSLWHLNVQSVTSWKSRKSPKKEVKERE